VRAARSHGGAIAVNGVRRLVPALYHRARWKNDGGWTTELARSEDAAGMRWRISIAEIERDGPFSEFPGVERDLLLLEGSGIELDIEGREPVRLAQRFARARFAGEVRVGCRLLAGPTRDFNVMARRAAVVAEVVARPLVGSMVVFAEAGTEWFVHLFAGHARAVAGGEAHALEAGDSLQVDFREPAAPRRVVLDGAGEALLVKFTPAA
jgi:environmental stress-induced protein Ves